MQIYSRIGQILELMNRLNDALIYYNKALSLAKDLGDIDTQASVLSGIASTFLHEGELDKALSYYNETLSSITNEKDKATIYNSIATIYFIKGDYQKAVEHLQKAIKIAEKYGDYQDASQMKLNLEGIYEVTRYYENAEKYLTDGLEGVKRAGDEFWEAKGYSYSGALYRDKGDKETAREYYTRAYDVFKSIGAEKDAQSVLNEIKALDELN